MIQTQNMEWEQLMMLGEVEMSILRSQSRILLYHIATGDMKMTHRCQRQCHRRRFQLELVEV